MLQKNAHAYCKKQVFRKFSTSFLIVMVKPNNYKNKSKKTRQKQTNKKKKNKKCFKI